MKVYMNTPDEVLAMTLASVQVTCYSRYTGTEWPDQVFDCVHREGISHNLARDHYESNLNFGLRFYVEAE